MLLGEPQRTPYDLNFVLAGVPVRVHPMFWLISAILGYAGNSGPMPVLIWTGVVFVSILVHEFGHVMAFRYFGVSSHVVLYSMGGLAVPNSGRLSGGTLPSFFIAIAGPLAGFAFIATIILGLQLSGKPVDIDFHRPVVDWFIAPFDIESIHMTRLVQDLLFVNIFWGLMNLLPVYPLDGGQASRAILTHFNPFDGVRQSLILSVLTGGGIALYAFVKLDAVYMAMMFGYLAYMSYATLQAYSGRGGFG